MKRALFLILPALSLFLASGSAQPTPVLDSPPCVQYFTFTAAGDATVAYKNYSSQLSGCNKWTLQYTSSGFSAVSVALQSAPDSSGVAGAFVTFAGTLVSGSNPGTATDQSEATFSGWYPWVRVTLGSATGSGTVRGKLIGQATVPGSTITATATISGPVQVEGRGTTGAAVLGNPVYVAGKDQAGNLQPVRTDANGGVAPSIQTTGDADNVSNSAATLNYPDTLTNRPIYVRTYPHYYNAVGWDRAPGNTLGGFFQGATANGASATENPTLIAGVDGSGNKRRMFTDGNGGQLLRNGAATMADGVSNSSASVFLDTSGGILYMPTRQWGFDGVTWQRLKTASVANMSSATSSGARLSEKGARSSVLCNTAGTQCSASVAAGGAGVRHVADCIGFSASTSAAVVATDLTIALRDGASGAGSIIWRYVVSATATTGDQVPPFTVCGLNLVGSDNTAMTLEWSAGLSNLRTGANLSYYDVQ